MVSSDIAHLQEVGKEAIATVKSRRVLTNSRTIPTGYGGDVQTKSTKYKYTLSADGHIFEITQNRPLSRNTLQIVYDPGDPSTFMAIRKLSMGSTKYLLRGLAVPVGIIVVGVGLIIFSMKLAKS